MIGVSYFLDCRAVKSGNLHHLKLLLTRGHDTALIPLNIKLEKGQWDKRNLRIVNHPTADVLNSYIHKTRIETEFVLLKLQEEIDIKTVSISELKNRVVYRDMPQEEIPKRRDSRKLFVRRLKEYAETKCKGTKGVYMQTLRRLQEYTPDFEKLTFEEMNFAWLSDFEAFLAKTACKNARNIHLRNIRAVFNSAIDRELTTAYPFRRFKIKAVQTRKRALSVSQLRTLMTCEVEPYAERHRDLFVLIFMLCGINLVDLYNLTEITDEGRVEYMRAKTNRFYSIRVEPEALELINKYKGQEKLLDIADKYKNHNDYTHHINNALKRIGKVTRSGLGGKKSIEPLFPELSTYWARHTWATIAASLDIPKETIARALGHGGNTVTDIYIDFDRKKIDEANRKVLDWVLYGKC